MATPLVKSDVFEDNNGALILATNNRITPRTKHIAIKCHHFRHHVGRSVNTKKISTDPQIVDTFTKGLPPKKFEEIRFLLMHW